MGYTVGFREEVVRRVLFKKNGDTIRGIAEEIGITCRTIRRWVKIYGCSLGAKVFLSNKKKVIAVLDNINVSFQEKSAYCRINGIYIEELNDWEKEMKKTLLNGAVSQLEYDKLKSEKLELAKELRLRNEEIKQKDKALSEAATLLLLQKKTQDLFSEEEEN